MKNLLGLLIFCAYILSIHIPAIAAARVPASAMVTGSEALLHRGADGDNAANILHRSEDLLQFKSGGHVIGFTPQRMYIVGMGYSLIETFAGTKGVTPIRGTGEQVRYSDLWPGISLRYETRESGIAESIYRVEPGADVRDIRLAYNSAVTVDKDGSLRFNHSSEQGRFTMSPPRAWQEHDGEDVAVAINYVRHDDQSIGFQVDYYNPTLPLIIDPVYQYHTFYGSALDDYSDGIVVDKSGNIYVTGHSDATWNGPGSWIFPLPKHSHSGSADIVVLKLNSSGNYLWHTFYGSASYDSGKSIAVDKNGNIYIVGRSSATWNGSGGELPKNGYSGITDIMVLKLGSNGDYLWHTFYGSAANTDIGHGVAVDESSNIYAIATCSDAWDGPGGKSPKNSYSGDVDIVVLKLNSQGDYLWHTFYGSADYDNGGGLAINENGNIYVTCYSADFWLGPGWALPLHTFSGGDYDIAVLKLNSDGDYLWHTFHGSDSPGHAGSTGIAVDGHGNAYVTGYSDVTWNGPGGESPKNSHSGDRDIMVLKLSNSGHYQYHTFYGSASSPSGDVGLGIAVDGRGNVYVAGRSGATWNGPGGKTPKNDYSGGSSDVMVLKLNSSGHYQYHTFYGSALDDYSDGIVVDKSGNIYVTGNSDATWNGPEGESPRNGYTGGTDIVILKFADPSFAWHMFRPAIDQGGRQP